MRGPKMLHLKIFYIEKLKIVRDNWLECNFYEENKIKMAS